MAYLCLYNLRFEAVHGVYEVEKKVPQPFRVDLRLRINPKEAILDDEIEKTVDYVHVYEIVERIIKDSSLNLLETLAYRIAHEVKELHPCIEAVTVEVHKLEARVKGDFIHSSVIYTTDEDLCASSSREERDS